MSATSTSVELVNVQRLMSLFAQGIGGRYFHLKSPSEEASNTGTHRHAFSSESPRSSDGNVLMVPQSIDLFAERSQNQGAYRVAVMHQLGYLEFGTCEFSWTTARGCINELADFPSLHPSQHPTDLELFFHNVRPAQLTRQVFNIVEDLRIDSALQRNYPGLIADLDRSMQHSLKQRRSSGSIPIDDPASLLESLVQLSLGLPASELLALDSTGLFRELARQLGSVSQPSADVYTSVRVTLAWVHGLRGLTVSEQPGPAKSEKLEAEIVPELSALADELETVEFRGNPSFELMQRRVQLEARELLEQAVQEAQGSALSEALIKQLEETGIESVAEGHVSGVTQSAAGLDSPAKSDIDTESLLRRITRRSDFDRSMLRRNGALPELATRSYLYDEWDHLQQLYLRGYCRLHEERLIGDSGAEFLSGVRHRHRELISRVRRQFQSARPEAYQRRRAMSDGEEIDLDRAIEAHIDRRAGLYPDDGIYTRRDRARREVSAAFLLDLSASVNTPVIDPADIPTAVDEDEDDDFRYWDPPPPPEPKRRVIDIEKEAVALMVDSLETLGDSYGIYGFSGSGRENVEFFVAKEFDEPLRSSVWGNIDAMRARSSTRMGPAIRHTITKLQHQGSRRKVLLLVSDGFPQDIDYGPDRGDREYGIQDTAKALAEAERAGIKTFCLTIDRAGHDYLRRMCPDQQYLVIDEVESLPEELGKVYRALTRS